MFSIQNKNNEYFLNSTKNFYEKNFKNRVNFLRNEKNFFKEISKKIGDVVSNSKSIIFFLLWQHFNRRTCNIKKKNCPRS